MLAKRNRLPSPQIRRVSKDGKRVRFPWFDIIFMKNDFEALRFACIISKKVDKRATVRNAIKRIAHDVIQKNTPAIVVVDIILIAKSREIMLQKDLASRRIYDALFGQNLISH